MSRHLVRTLGGVSFLSSLVVIAIFIYDNNLHKQEDGLNNPSSIGSYEETGYFKIDPETILTSLESKAPNFFIPLSRGEAYNLKKTTDLAIDWTQADFLKIASALGKLAWNDPMDLNEWSVYDISFLGICEDRIGLHSAKITYFRIERDRYTTRLIEIEPYLGWARYGDGRTYPQPILRKWKRVDLTGVKTSADEALQRTKEDAKTRPQTNNNSCDLMVYASRFDPKNWHLSFWFESADSINYSVNLDTGDITQKTK